MSRGHGNENNIKYGNKAFINLPLVTKRDDITQQRIYFLRKKCVGFIRT